MLINIKGKERRGGVEKERGEEGNLAGGDGRKEEKEKKEGRGGEERKGKKRGEEEKRVGEKR